MSGYLRGQKGGTLRVGGTDLPGVIDDVEVTGSLEIEKKGRDGKSGSVKVLHGFTDAGVRIHLTVIGATRTDAMAQVRTIDKVFKTAAGGSSGTPSQNLRVVEPQLDARGVRRLLFQKLTTAYGDTDNVVACTLEFTEYDAEVARLEDKDAGSGATNPDGSPAASKTKNADGTPKVPGPLDQFTRGVNVGVGAANSVGRTLGLKK